MPRNNKKIIIIKYNISLGVRNVITSSSEKLALMGVGLTVFAAVFAIKKCFWPLLSTVKVFLQRTMKQSGPVPYNI